MPVECMLTTVDNPYDPFTQWDDWYAYDFQMGHHSPGLVSRIVVTSTELSDEDQRRAIEFAIDEIIREDPLDIYKKVSRERPP